MKELHMEQSTCPSPILKAKSVNHPLVKNIRFQEYDVYCGRPRKGSTSLLGNPFVIGPDGTREEVIAKHIAYADYRFEHDPEFKAAVLALKGKKLGCFCNPQACHCTKLAELANSV
jgi:hypothetical protein